MADAETPPKEQASRLVEALRAQGVVDPDVLEVIETTPRDLFTPELFKAR